VFMAVFRNGTTNSRYRRIYVQSATNSKSQKLPKVSLTILRQRATAHKSTLYIMAGSSFKNPRF
jgi:predicted transposase YdaD